MRHETAKRNGGMDGGSERWKRSGNKKKREVRWVWVDLVLLADERPVCMCACVCEGDSGGRGGITVVVHFSGSADGYG